jgi:hypothetical protein
MRKFQDMTKDEKYGVVKGKTFICIHTYGNKNDTKTQYILNYIGYNRLNRNYINYGLRDLILEEAIELGKTLPTFTSCSLDSRNLHSRKLNKFINEKLI